MTVLFHEEEIQRHRGVEWSQAIRKGRSESLKTLLDCMMMSMVASDKESDDK